MRRYVAAAAASAAACLMLGACSTAGSGSGSSSSGTLTVWTNSADQPAITAAYTRFEKLKGIKFNIVSIPASSFENTVATKWSAGDKPDILEYQATSLFWALDPAKNLMDLSSQPFVKESGDLYKVVGSQNGKVYAAITEGPEEFGLFYNKKVLADAGLQPPQTFADIEHICSVLKAKDPSVAPIAESGGSQWPLQVLPLMYMGQYEKTQGYTEQLLTKKTTMASPSGPFAASLTAYKQLQTNGCFNKDATTATYQDNEKAVLAGTAAMTDLNSGVITDFVQDAGSAAKADATVGFATPSATEAVASGAPNPSGTWFVPLTGNSANEKIALEFVNYVTGAGYQTYLNQSKDFPIISGGQQDPGASQLQQAAAAAYKNGFVLAFNSNLPGFGADFPVTMSQLLSGQITPSAAASQSQTQLVQGATAAGTPGF